MATAYDPDADGEMAAIMSARRLALADAIEAVQAEAVEIDPDDHSPTDVSYNLALEHAVAAIRALAP